jgi:ABC-type nitrate/sulfonate/bicarbonate transport system permease component
VTDLATTARPSAPRPLRSSPRRPSSIAAIKGSPRFGLALGLLVGGVLWEVAGRYWLDEIFFASLSRTLLGFGEMVREGELSRALRESLQLFVNGFTGGATVGLVLGVVIARVRSIGAALEDYVTILYVTPPIALVPFVLTILGFGVGPKSLIVAWFVFFPVCITTIEGVRAVSPRLIEVAHSFGSSEARIWRDVVIPSTVPYAMSGLRQGIALGFVGVVAAEFLLDSSGIGLLLRSYQRSYRMDKLLAAVLLMTTLGLVVMALGRALERKVAAWRQ